MENVAEGCCGGGGVEGVGWREWGGGEWGVGIGEWSVKSGVW